MCGSNWTGSKKFNSIWFSYFRFGVLKPKITKRINIKTKQNINSQSDFLKFSNQTEQKIFIFSEIELIRTGALALN